MLMRSVAIKSIVLNVVMLSVVMLSVIVLSVVMLSVGAPQACPGPMSNIATTFSLREIFGLMKNKKKER